MALASADEVAVEASPATAPVPVPVASEAAVEIEDISEDLSSRELALAAKARGNKAHSLNTLEGFVVAVAAYKEAISHDPTDHIFYANLCASYIELSKVKWKPGEVVDAAAKAVEAATKCTTMAPTWAKGFLRQATAEECSAQGAGQVEGGTREAQDQVGRGAGGARRTRAAAGERAPRHNRGPLVGHMRGDLPRGACSSIRAAHLSE